MPAKLQQTILSASLALLLAGTAGNALAEGQKPAVDMGVAPASEPATVTMVLKLRHREALAQFIQRTITPGNRDYHRFLSTAQFAERYGASAGDIRRIEKYLDQQGLRYEVLPNHLAVRVEGSLDQLGRLFGTSIHTFRDTDGRRFRRPASRPHLPAAIAGSVLSTAGLSTEHQYVSHRVGVPKPLSVNLARPALAARSATKAGATAAGNPTSTGTPGAYTVGDVADLYHINPLYDHGIKGKGTTVGIVTLSSFYPRDAETYWDAIGLKTPPHRIWQIHVDGGGAIDNGTGETTLDVEQAGGLAPQAKIVVYDAPNAGNGFIDAFLQAVSDNCADSLSTSWGLPEIYNFAALNVDGASVDDTSDAGNLQAFHEVFMEAAAQGQSVFVASGDSGAYDTVRGLGHGDAPGTFNAPLTVDSPASDPYVIAAGGTTVPFSFAFGSGPVETIERERVWGWDYLQDYFDTNFGEGVVDLFSVGGGGGVSSYWTRPFYQWFTPGVRRTEPGQSLVYHDTSGPIPLVKLPGRFPGRNVPDISLNADPETGYLVFSSTEGGLISGMGGTSFVAPQLNGISALLTQSTGHRIGYWNPQVYFLHGVFGHGPWSAFHAVRDGTNWFYRGSRHYAPAAGLGTLDVANLDQFLRSGL